MLYLKPVYSKDKLVSIALCYADVILVDEDIIEHFDPDTKGVDIKKLAIEMGYAREEKDFVWGSVINVN